MNVIFKFQHCATGCLGNCHHYLARYIATPASSLCGVGRDCRPPPSRETICRVGYTGMDV